MSKQQKEGGDYKRKMINKAIAICYTLGAITIITTAVTLKVFAETEDTKLDTYYVIEESVDIEEQVFGSDPCTDFVPGTYIAKDIEPEEEYYESMELLAKCVEAEAANQGLDGKRLVVDVIFNRVDDPDWPDTITGVITKPREFSTYWDGAIEKAVPTQETYDAIKMELQQRSWPSLYYFTSEGYHPCGTPWKKIGDHYFSKK